MNVVQVEFTTRCNHHCIMCNRGTEIYDMTEETATNICEKIPELEHIHIAGSGEPGMHPHLYEIAKVFRDHGITSTLVTNGSISTIPWDMFTEVLLSLHDTNPVRYNRITGGNIEDVIPNIKHVDIVYNVITSINGPFMDTIVQDEYKYGARIVVNVPIKGWFITGKFVDTSEIEYDSGISLPKSAKGASKIFISARGNVVPWCSVLDPNKYLCGNINTDTIDEIVSNLLKCKFKQMQ